MITRRNLFKCATLAGLGLATPPQLGWATAPTRNLLSRSGATLVSWSSLTGWGAEGAGSTLAAESSILPPYGGSAARVSNSNTGGTSQASIYTAGPFNLTSTSTIVEVPVYVPTDHIGGSFRLALGSGGGFTNMWSKDISSSKTMKGWNLFRLRLSDMTQTGSPDVTAINSIRIRSVSPAGYVGHAIFGPITASRAYRPWIVLSFDDGLKTVYSAAKPLLDAYGLQATIFCGWNNLFGATTLSMSELRELYSAGWDISSHLYNQAPILTSGYTATQQQDEITANKIALAAAGWSRGNDFLSWPGGEHDDTVMTMASTAGVTLARTTQNEPFPLSGDGLYSRHRVPGWSFDSGSRTAAQTVALMQAHVQSGQSTIWYGHNIATPAVLSTDISVAELTIILKEAARLRDSNLASVGTLSQFYEAVTSGRVSR
ncbi:MAG: polysaccharide deacetylase family protein [Nitrospira sp.]